MSTAQDVLNLARSQLFVGENPMGSNSGTPYHAWYGAESQGWQWCAIFVSWVLFHTDPALFWNLKTAYSGDYLNVGRMHGREIDLSQIAPGDICIWDRPVGGITDHIGFVESVTPTTFTTIEGNSGDSVKRNANRPRVQTSSCHYYFVRPAYSTTPTTKHKQPQEDDMEIVETGKAKRFPAYNDGGTANCGFDISDESPGGTGAKVRLFFRRNDGDKGYADQQFAKDWTFDLLAEGSRYINVRTDLKVQGSITLKVEVLSGGPVGVTRRQEL